MHTDSLSSVLVYFSDKGTERFFPHHSSSRRNKYNWKGRGREFIFRLSLRFPDSFSFQRGDTFPFQLDLADKLSVPNNARRRHRQITSIHLDLKGERGERERDEERQPARQHALSDCEFPCTLCPSFRTKRWVLASLLIPVFLCPSLAHFLLFFSLLISSSLNSLSSPPPLLSPSLPLLSHACPFSLYPPAPLFSPSLSSLSRSPSCPSPSERQARLETVREVFLAAYSSTVGLKSSVPSPSGAISGLLEQFARGVGLRGTNSIV